MTNPVLVEVYRNQVLESFHRGVICVVNENDEVIFSKGDIHQVCYPRSAMKFFQVLPLIESGGIEKFNFSLEEIAIMCGSHNAEADHLRVVRSILHKIRLHENDLQCGPQYPTSNHDADLMKAKGEKPHAIHNNCSGKHAGMLALCMLLQLDHRTYLDPNHPIQRMIQKVCEEMYQYPASKMVTALDGCSAPIYSIPVLQQAIGFKNLIHAASFGQKREESCKIVIQAVSEFPFMVAGSKRYCTDMMRITAPTVIGKTGAEGIFCMTFTEQKWGVCIKIDDGKMQPQYHVAQSLLEATGLFPAEKLKPLHHYAEVTLKNFNKFTTGDMKTNEAIFSDFNLLL